MPDLLQRVGFIGRDSWREEGKLVIFLRSFYVDDRFHC